MSLIRGQAEQITALVFFYNCWWLVALPLMSLPLVPLEDAAEEGMVDIMSCNMFQ